MPVSGSAQIHRRLLCVDRRKSAKGGNGLKNSLHSYTASGKPGTCKSSPQLNITCSRRFLRMSPGSYRSYCRSLLPPIRAAPLCWPSPGGIRSVQVIASGHPLAFKGMHPKKELTPESCQQKGACFLAAAAPWGRECAPQHKAVVPDRPPSHCSRGGTGARDVLSFGVWEAELGPDLQERRRTAQLDADLRGKRYRVGLEPEQESSEVALNPDLQEKRCDAELDSKQEERYITESGPEQRIAAELDLDQEQKRAAELGYYNRSRIAEWVLRVNEVLFSPSQPQTTEPRLMEQDTAIKIVYQGD